MILAISGTHEQQFDRMVRVLDRIAEQGVSDSVFVQYGYSSPPKHADGAELLPIEELGALADRADLIVTHGGPGSIWMAFERGKVPIVFPRQKGFDEHVDNHQCDFAEHLASAKRIIMTQTEEELEEAIRRYDELKQGLNVGTSRAHQNLVELGQWLRSLLPKPEQA